MTPSTTSEQPQHSRLLQLPREVRDLIYREALVRDVVPIGAAVIKISDDMGRELGYYCHVKNKFPSRYSWSHRRLWSVRALDIRCNFGPRDRAEHPQSRSIHMTYQLAGGKMSFARLR